MVRQFVRCITRALAAGIISGNIAVIGLLPAVSVAQGADSAIPASASDVAYDSDKSPEPAQPPPTQESRAPRSAFDPLAERIRYLHNRLRITPAQEPLWANLVQVMRENANSMSLLLKERFQSLKSGNAIDSINTYERLGETQLEGLKKFTAAFQALYDSLSDDQKKIADVMFRLGLLRVIGSGSQPAVQLVAPAPYPEYSPPPTAPAYPAYPSYAYPSYAYPSYDNSLVFGPLIGVGPTFFFPRRHPGFLVVRRPGRVAIPAFRLAFPPIHAGVPPIHAGLPPVHAGVPPIGSHVPPLLLGVPPGRAAVMQFRSR